MFVVTCDYLEIYLRGDFEGHRTACFVFEPIASTRLYATGYNVKYRGVLFGQLYLHPRMETMKKDACHFKLDNEQLYLKYTNSVIIQFLEQTGLKYVSVTRLDIACDFHAFENGYSVAQFVADVNMGVVARRGREGAWKPHYTGRSLQGVSFGSRSSERHGRLYNKTEYLKKDNKPYITKWHEQNGLAGADVWRLEFTLRGKEVKRMARPERLTQDGRADLNAETVAAMGTEHSLLSNDLLRGIFLVEMASYFTYVPLTKTGTKSKRKTVPLISAASFTQQPDLIVRLATKRAPAGSSYRYKLAVRTLLLDYYLHKEERYFYTALTFVERYNLGAVVHKRMPFWWQDFAPWIDKDFEYLDLRGYCSPV